MWAALTPERSEASLLPMRLFQRRELPRGRRVNNAYFTRRSALQCGEKLASHTRSEDRHARQRLAVPRVPRANDRCWLVERTHLASTFFLTNERWARIHVFVAGAFSLAQELEISVMSFHCYRGSPCQSRFATRAKCLLDSQETLRNFGGLWPAIPATEEGIS
jgi:hypothetical protein